MPKVYVDGHERYPLYTLSETPPFRNDVPLAVTALDLTDYRRVMHEFERWQRRLAKMADTANDLYLAQQEQNREGPLV